MYHENDVMGQHRLLKVCLETSCSSSGLLSVTSPDKPIVSHSKSPECRWGTFIITRGGQAEAALGLVHEHVVIGAGPFNEVQMYKSLSAAGARKKRTHCRLWHPG